MSDKTPPIGYWSNNEHLGDGTPFCEHGEATGGFIYVQPGRLSVAFCWVSLVSLYRFPWPRKTAVNFESCFKIIFTYL